MKETQADFGLTAGAPAVMELPPAASIETSESEARPYSVGEAHPSYYFLKRCGCGNGSLCAGSARAEGTHCARLLERGFKTAAAPTPAGLPTDGAARKRIPMYSGLIAYFPQACAAVAGHSWVGNEQHHPGQPLHWDKAKSTDHADCIVRHLTDYAISGDITELKATAWRALALLQTALEKAAK